EQRQRRLGHDQRARPDQVGHLELAGLDDVRALQVAERADERVLTALDDDHQRALGAPAGEQLDRARRLRLVDLRGVHRRQAAGGRVGRERDPQRLDAGLAVDLAGVAARVRAEHDAAAGPLRGADRALTGATGALLAPWLGAAPGHEAAGLGRV